MASGSFDAILPFLGSTNRSDVRQAAVSGLIELTGSVEGRKTLYKSCPGVIDSVIRLLKDPDPVVVKNCFIFLINISSDKEGTVLMLRDHPQNSPSKEEAAVGNNTLSLLLDNVLDPKSSLADHASAILANITRYPAQTDQLFDFLEANKEKYHIRNLASAFTRNNYNEAKCLLDHLAFFFANLSQSTKFRSIFLNHEDNIIKSFLLFIGYEKSLIRKGGVVALIKNCCFNEGSHEWLLSPDVDILPHLLLPLAGPEQLDDEDNEKLPVDLQYLPEDKTRESEPFIRKSLLETLLLLCATKKCRTTIRDQNAYIILRELHKWETDSEVLVACENVVDILIRTEEEIGIDNLLELEVPSDLKEKFNKLDLENQQS